MCAIADGLSALVYDLEKRNFSIDILIVLEMCDSKGWFDLENFVECDAYELEYTSEVC